MHQDVTDLQELNMLLLLSWGALQIKHNPVFTQLMKQILVVQQSFQILLRGRARPGIGSLLRTQSSVVVWCLSDNVLARSKQCAVF